MAKLDLNVIAKNNPNDKYQIVEFRGEMDKSNIVDIRDAVTKFVDTYQDPYLIFDLTYLNFVNSEGVGLMVSIYYKIKKSGKEMFIVNPQPQVKDVFTTIGLTQVVNPLETLDEAISKMK